MFQGGPLEEGPLVSNPPSKRVRNKYDEYMTTNYLHHFHPLAIMRDSNSHIWILTNVKRNLI